MYGLQLRDCRNLRSEAALTGIIFLWLLQETLQVQLYFNCSYLYVTQLNCLLPIAIKKCHCMHTL